MKKRNWKMFSPLLILILASCSSPAAYQQADGRGYGYTEKQISHNHYRIHFKARGDDTGAAMDYAMLRAGELSLEEEFDWFAIMSRETLVDRQRAPSGAQSFSGTNYETVRNCNLLNCRSYQRPVSRYHSSMHLGDARSDVEVILEVRMGTGIRPDEGESYDAREVFENLETPE